MIPFIAIISKSVEKHAIWFGTLKLVGKYNVLSWAIKMIRYSAYWHF